MPHTASFGPEHHAAKTRSVTSATGTQAHARRAMGANLIVVGALGALAAIALVILLADPGGPDSRAPHAPVAAVDGSAAITTSPATHDRSWLCNVVSDDSPLESRAAVAESLAHGAITCSSGPLVDARPPS